MPAWPALGMLLATAGSVALYLSVRHQQCLARPLPARPARVAGFALLAVSLPAFLQVMQAVVAVFVLVTWAMLMCVALPHLDALRMICRRPPND